MRNYRLAPRTAEQSYRPDYRLVQCVSRYRGRVSRKSVLGAANRLPMSAGYATIRRMNRSLYRPARHAATALFLLLLLILAGCSSAPPPPPEAAPDTGFAYRKAAAPQFEEPPEPFIRMVDLARLRVGMTREEVLALFPDPRAIDVSVRGLEVWEYGFAQLHFRGGILANWFDLTRERR